MRTYNIKCYKPVLLFEFISPIKAIKNLIALPELFKNPLNQAYIAFSEPFLSENQDEIQLPKEELVRGRLGLNLNLEKPWKFQFQYKSNRSLDEVTLNHIKQFGGETYVPDVTKPQNIVIHKNIGREQLREMEDYYRQRANITQNYQHSIAVLAEERLLSS